MSHWVKVGLVAAAAAVVGCSDSDGDAAELKNVTMTATAAGAWAEASCLVTGSSGAVFGPFVTTFPDGVTSLDNIPAAELPALVSCEGGRYFDPDSAVFEPFPDDVSLRGAIPSAELLTALNDSIAVNAFTDGVAAMAFAVDAADQDAGFIERAANAYVELVLPGFPGTGRDLLSPPTIINASGFPQLTSSVADVYTAYLLSLADGVSGTKDLQQLIDSILALFDIAGQLALDVANSSGSEQAPLSLTSAQVEQVRTLTSRANEALEALSIPVRVVVADNYTGSTNLLVNIVSGTGGTGGTG